LKLRIKREIDAWGQKEINTSNPTEAAKLKAALTKNRFKRNWESSVIFFESDRTIQKINPLTFTWDLPDPNEEQAGWNSTFGGIKNRYQDTVHSIFKLIEFQKRNIAIELFLYEKKEKHL
jgi:hypothetical protein